MILALPPVLSIAASATPPALAAGTYTYRSTVGGAAVGTSTIVVKRNADVTEVDETTSGTIQGVAASATATMALSGDLSPASYRASYQGGGQSASTSVTVNGATAAMNGTTGAKTISLAPNTTHFVIVDGAMLAGFFALPAQMQAWSASSVTALAPVYGQSVPLPIDAAKPARPHSVPAADAAVNVGGQVPFTVWYDPATYVADEIDVPSQQIVVTRNR